MESLPSASARRTQNLQYDNLAPARTGASQSPSDTVTRLDLQSSNQPVYQAPPLLSLIFTPVNILYRIFAAVFSPLGALFPFLPRLLSRFNPNSYPAARTRNASGRRTLPPRDNAQRFIRELNEEYGEETHTLPFVESGFNLALDNAKSQLKYLLVILLSPEHDDTVSWVRSTLLSPQVKNFLRDHKNEVILWGGNVQDSEAYQAADHLRCTKFPFAALIVHTPDVSSTAMSVVCRATGPTTPSELVAKLGAAITSNNDALSRVRAQQSERLAAQNLRQEQDSAYERSLARDRERARQRREEETARAAAEKAALEAAAAAELRKRYAEQWRLARKKSVLPPPSTDDKTALRLRLRLPPAPDSEQPRTVTQRFSSESSLEEIYAFVECYDVEISKEGAADVDVEAPPADQYTHEYKFRLVTPTPRQVFEAEKGVNAKEKIGNGATVFVEALEEDDDDDDVDEDEDEGVTA